MLELLILGYVMFSIAMGVGFSKWIAPSSYGGEELDLLRGIGFLIGAIISPLIAPIFIGSVILKFIGKIINRV